MERPLLVASGRWDGRRSGSSRPRAGPRCRPSRSRRRSRQWATASSRSAAAARSTSAKAISAEAGVPVVSVPTTYSGAEWTTFFGIRSPDRKMKGGGSGAVLGAAVYEPELTLTLPRAETVGTALNALAHAAEALYVQGRNPESDEHALRGAALIGEWLPRVVEAPGELEGRTKLLRGRDARRGRARRLDAGAGSRDGAGARRARTGSRTAAMNAIRLPARAAIQRGGRPGRDRPLRPRARNRRSCHAGGGAGAARRLRGAAGLRRPRGGAGGRRGGHGRAGGREGEPAGGERGRGGGAAAIRLVAGAYR